MAKCLEVLSLYGMVEAFELDAEEVFLLHFSIVETLKSFLIRVAVYILQT